MDELDSSKAEVATDPRVRASVVVAAAASLGAGAVHAAAIGAHSEHPMVVRTFAILAVLQLGWGVLVVIHPRRWVAAAGVVLGVAAATGWVLAKMSGIGFIDGLENPEAVQWADGLCAGLAAVSAAGAAVHFSTLRTGRSAIRPAALPGRFARLSAIAITVMSLTGMTSAANHQHDHDHADVASHDHADAHSDSDHTSGTSTPKHSHASSTGSPYDPAKPIDLGGVAGVTPEQQARAENLVAIVLWKLPQFADVASLESKGYHSIGDSMTGDEHYVNWSYLDDGRTLDPDHPESLVFEMIDGRKTLVSAMFMTENGVTLDTVPDVGGALTQWHIHSDLCYTQSDPPVIAALTPIGGECPSGTRSLGTPRPMIHVWIRPNQCGPFAALEGIGAGQVKAGESTACDTVHGSHSN